MISFDIHNPEFDIHNSCITCTQDTVHDLTHDCIQFVCNKNHRSIKHS